MRSYVHAYVLNDYVRRLHDVHFQIGEDTRMDISGIKILHNNILQEDFFYTIAQSRQYHNLHLWHVTMKHFNQVMIRILESIFLLLNIF